MMELLFFLLPVAAASGWYAHHRYSQYSINTDTHETTAESRAEEYYRGVNYLLNQQPDRALEVFLEMVKLDSDTLETHFALGILYRQQGRVERAIRIHQHIVDRQDLTIEQRAQALLALGQDHLSAGLYDRAETLLQDVQRLSQLDTTADLSGLHQVINRYLKIPFNSLLKRQQQRVVSPVLRQYAEQASRLLMTIYEYESDWQTAIDTAIVLAGTQSSHAEHQSIQQIAHYYCELACVAVQDPALARRYYREALIQAPDLIRAHLGLGRLDLAQDDFTSAFDHFMVILQQDADFLPEVMAECCLCQEQGVDTAELTRWLLQTDHLDNVAQLQTGMGVYDQIVRYIQNQSDTDNARQYLENLLQQQPQLSILRSWLTLNRPCRVPKLDHYLQQITDRVSSYQCRQCGFTGDELHWQCPSCRQWGIIKPGRLINAETCQ